MSFPFVFPAASVDPEPAAPCEDEVPDEAALAPPFLSLPIEKNDSKSLNTSSKLPGPVVEVDPPLRLPPNAPQKVSAKGLKPPKP